LISPEPISPEHETERPRSIAFVALLIAAFAVLAAIYGICVVTAVLPFNSGTWVVGEDVASRGWLGYMLSAIIHFVAALGLWLQWRWARWLAIFLLAIGLLPAVPGISAAVVDLRISGIAIWGTLIILRTASLYVMFNAE
jgi:hypothetical protein